MVDPLFQIYRQIHWTGNGYALHRPCRPFIFPFNGFPVYSPAPGSIDAQEDQRLLTVRVLSHSLSKEK